VAERNVFWCASCGANTKISGFFGTRDVWDVLRWHIGAERPRTSVSGHCANSLERAARHPSWVKASEEALREPVSVIFAEEMARA
jgi:hypothetical protein